MPIKTDFSLQKWFEKSDGLTCLFFTDIVGFTSLLSEICVSDSAKSSLEKESSGLGESINWSKYEECVLRDLMESKSFGVQLDLVCRKKR